MDSGRAWRPSAGGEPLRAGGPRDASGCPPETVQSEIRRLKTRPDFLRVAAARRKWVTPGLILQALRRRAERAGFARNGRDGARIEDAGVIRVGFTASRKVGMAVQRNRARRRLRAAVAEVLPVMGRAGHDYVVIARAATLARPYAALIGDLRTALGGLSRDRKRDRGGGRGGTPREAGQR